MKKADVIIAYKKLKSYVYHENFSLSLRIKLAEFETADVETKLDDLTRALTSYQLGKKDALNAYFKKIDISIFPKSFSEEITPNSNEAFFYSNQNKRDEYKVDRITPFIECSVELHIINVLWIMFIGFELDSELNEDCYGNRLERNKDDEFVKGSIKLFNKYYLKYSEWRDEGIKKARELHTLKLDVAILNLDLKNYYNSVDFDLRQLKINGDYDWLSNILANIHDKYVEAMFKTQIVADKRNLLPIGLLSSSIIANYYLKDFDKQVVKKLKPAFYGRYVDDIIFVFANPQIDTSEAVDVCDQFIKEILIKNQDKKFKYFGKEKGKYYINVKENKIYFQPNKVKLFHFLSTESINLLEEFEKEIRKNSSEFKLEPESEDVLSSFETSSYTILYSDTINKLRSIDGFSTNKFGASKHLSKLITATKTINKIEEKDFKEIDSKIMGFFSGKRGLELSSLWEKVFTFYLINQRKKEIIFFTKAQIHAISNLKKGQRTEIKNSSLIGRMQRDMLSHLINCFAMAASLNRGFFSETVLKEIKDSNLESEINSELSRITTQNIDHKAKALIDANLFRHNYLYYPLLNYCQQTEDFDFNRNNLAETVVNFEIDDLKVKYSPRFLHYHELCIFYQLKALFSTEYLQSFTSQEQIFDDFITLNRLEKRKSKYKKAFPASISFAQAKRKHEGLTLEIPSHVPIKKFRIGLVNVKVNSNNSVMSMRGNPNLDFKRLDQINHVLNESIGRQKVDLIVFPEISIPYQWLPHLTSFAKKNNVGIVCGLEHITNNKNQVMNYVTTILPFTAMGYRNALVDFRLKIDYSPFEEKQIKGWKLKLPLRARGNEKLRRYVWRGAQFGVFNCFELADIRKRAIFRGKVDFIATVEHNHDTNYFSNITESVSRDIHAFIVQVNTSDFGDSRITQPSGYEQKDLLKVKGGENILLITGEINIHHLREFQKKHHSLQELDATFKYTPPNFDYERQ